MAFAVLVAAVLVAYGGTFDDEFIFDDRLEIIENPFVHDLSNVGKILTTPSWGFQSRDGQERAQDPQRAQSHFYRPAQYITYAVLYRLFGNQPAGFHAYKVLLHVTACLLFYVVLVHHRPRVALPCALLFAVHPALSEAVSWISAVNDVACATFFLASLVSYLRWRQHPRAIDLVFLYAAFLLGMFSKETMVAFIPVLLLHRRLWEGPWPPIHEWKRVYLPLASIVALYLVMRWVAIGGFFVAGHGHYTHLPAWTVVPNSIYLLWRYLLKLTWPEPLNAYHMFDPITSVVDRRSAAALGALAAVALFVAWLRRRLPAKDWALVVWGLAWAALALSPAVLLFRHIGENVLAERYLYLPALGFILAAGMAGAAVLDRRPAAAMALVMALAGAGIWRIRARSVVWQDSVAFYEDLLRQSPRAQLWQSMGDAYADAGRLAEAEAAYQKMLALHPKSHRAYCNLGIVYDQMGRIDDAITAYEVSLELKPNEMAFSNLGIAHHKKGRFEQAILAYQRAIELKPTARAYFNLGTTYHFGTKQPREAAEAYVAALRLEPGDAEIVATLELARADADRLDSGRE